ncbi:MAG: hypothetical protein AB8H79_24115 [Myxococcota bacterium]
MRTWIVLLALVGCGSDDGPTDVVDSGDTGEPDRGCDETELFIDGPDSPRVSQSWTVLMRCDGDTLAGPMIVRFTPSELVTIDENEVTFVGDGDGELRVQVGVFVETLAVTIRP